MAIYRTDLPSIDRQAQSLIELLGKGQAQKAQQDADMQKQAALLSGQQANESAKLNTEYDLEQRGIGATEARLRAFLTSTGQDPRKVAITVNKNGYGANPETSPFAAMDARDALKKKDEMRKASIADFIVPNEDIIPSTKDAEEIKKLNAARRSANVGSESLNQELDKSSFMDRLGPVEVPFSKYIAKEPAYFNQNASVSAYQVKAAQLMGDARAMHDMGVLTPGEIGTAEKLAGALTGMAAARSSPEKLRQRLDALNQYISDRVAEKSRARGYEPKPGALEAPVLSKEYKKRRMEELLRKAKE